MQNPTKILFVCFANICRSPIAEGIAQYIVNNENLAIEVDSAGTSHRYEGEHPCQYSVHIASKKGIDISRLRSRPISKEDIENFDYVVGMDERNKQELINFGFKQVYKLGDFGGFKGKDVPDPYFFQSHEGLEEVFDMINIAVKDFFAQHSYSNKKHTIHIDINIKELDYQNKRDTEALVFLLDSYAKDPMGGSKALTKSVKDELPRALSKIPNAFSIMAYVDAKPAALINCFETFSTFHCKPIVNIHDLIVLEKYRSLGLSQKLLQKVEAIAVNKECCKITLEVLEGNDIAQAAYRNFGFSSYELDPKMGKAMFWQKLLLDGSQSP